MSSGPSKWARIYRRLTTMDRAEMVDRIRQQATARLDVLRYRAGSELVPECVATGDHLPQFFFAPQSVPALCSKLRSSFPEAAAGIVSRAERICQHRFDLLGYEGIDYGAEIEWHSDRIHGKHAPRKPWYQVKYLDFAEVGDSKVTWELNRHQHFVTLAKAYRISGDEKYAIELFRQWHHWHAENPYPIGINWASSLEVAFRSISWLWMYSLMAGTPAMPPEFRQDWLRALSISGRHIDCYLSTYFSPNTHLLGEAVALFFIGTLCPEIPAAATWQERGWRILQEEAVKQVGNDGFHFEQSSYYHVYALDFFLHTAILASANRIDVPKEYGAVLERMLDALAVLAKSGAIPRFGDDDGGRLFDSSRNQGRHMFDPLATGAVLFGRGDFKALAGGPREETLWLLGESGLEEFERLPSTPPRISSTALRTSGLYVMGDERQKWQLVIDAGPQGAHTAGHGHADALSLTASSQGHDLLIDSGTFQYVGPNAERDRFRGTRAHNTLMIAGVDQAEPRGPFGWEQLPNVQAEGWIVGKTFDLFMGSHDGYTRLANPVVHRRFVFALKSGFWLVRDLAEGSGESQLDLFWHLADELQERNSGSGLFQSDHSLLRFVTLEDHGWLRSVEQHEDSPAYGRKQSHPVLHLGIKAKLPTEFVTVLLPGVEARDAAQSLSKIAASSESSCVAYRYQTSNGEYWIGFGQGEVWNVDGWSSDAEFFCVKRMPDASIPVVICCNATYLDWENHRLLGANRRVLRCEIMGGEEPELISSDAEAVTLHSATWKILSKSTQTAGKIS